MHLIPLVRYKGIRPVVPVPKTAGDPREPLAYFWGPDFLLDY